MRMMLIYYLLAENVLTFIVYGVDKWKAQRGRWRVPEATLMGLAALGGSVGAWLAMQLFRHKTQKKKFRYGVPALFVLQVAAVLFYLNMIIRH
ncbi:MAG: DUF1294 domain-containing protein [Bacteroidaceae bacterium]|nr:DUF1294 domain-containing protein [Bacteroidaceae bacterium]